MARNSRHGRWGQCLSERQPNEPKTSRRRKCLTLDQFPYIRSTPLSQYPHRRCLNSKTRLTCANYNSETLEFRSKATASPNDPAVMLNETAAVMQRSQPRTRTRGAEGRGVRPGRLLRISAPPGALALFQILLQLSSRSRFDSTESRRPRNGKRAGDRVRWFNNSAKKDKEGAAGERQRTVEGSPAISGKGAGGGDGRG